MKEEEDEEEEEEEEGEEEEVEEEEEKEEEDEEEEAEEEDDDNDDDDDDDDAGPSSTQLARRVSCIMPSCNAYLIQGQLYYSPRYIPHISQRKINGCATAFVAKTGDSARGCCYSRAMPPWWHKIIASFIPGNDLIAGYG